MQFESIIRSFFQPTTVTEGKGLQFRHGQIFFGKLGKLHSGQYAEISLAGQKVMAKIEAPLISGKGYWFQVSHKSGEITLKVLEQDNKTFNNNGQSQPTPQLLGLRDTKPHRMLTDFLMKNQLSLTREEIQQGARFLNSANDRKTALQVLSMMGKNQIPFTKSIFNSLYAVLSDYTPLSTSFGHLQKLLMNEKNATDSAKALLHLLKEWQMNAKQLEKGTDALIGREALLAKMKESVFKLGIDYEARLAHDQLEKIEMQVKPLLVKLVQESSEQMNTRIQENAEKMLWKLNGQQLLSVNNQGIQTITHELPIQLGKSLTDLTIQWTGRKLNNGQLDSDYCHIVFYLDLDSLKSTVINMQVQNRIVNVFVYNDWNEIKTQAQPFIPILQAGLKSLNYNLSGIYFKNPQSSNEQIRRPGISFELSVDTGVDIRI